MRTKLLCGLIAAVLTLPAMADKPAFSVNGQAVSQARVEATQVAHRAAHDHRRLAADGEVDRAVGRIAATYG